MIANRESIKRSIEEFLCKYSDKIELGEHVWDSQTKRLGWVRDHNKNIWRPKAVLISSIPGIQAQGRWRYVKDEKDLEEFQRRVRESRAKTGRSDYPSEAYDISNWAENFITQHLKDVRKQKIGLPVNKINKNVVEVSGKQFVINGDVQFGNLTDDFLFPDEDEDDDETLSGSQDKVVKVKKKRKNYKLESFFNKALFKVFKQIAFVGQVPVMYKRENGQMAPTHGAIDAVNMESNEAWELKAQKFNSLTHVKIVSKQQFRKMLWSIKNDIPGAVVVGETSGKLPLMMLYRRSSFIPFDPPFSHDLERLFLKSKEGFNKATIKNLKYSTSKRKKIKRYKGAFSFLPDSEPTDQDFYNARKVAMEMLSRLPGREYNLSREVLEAPSEEDFDRIKFSIIKNKFKHPLCLGMFDIDGQWRPNSNYRDNAMYTEYFQTAVNELKPFAGKVSMEELYKSFQRIQAKFTITSRRKRQVGMDLIENNKEDLD